jgi:hypothetical protein
MSKRPYGGEATGRVPQRQSYSVTNGTVTVGRVVASGPRWLAYDASGRIVGAYSTMQAAMAALPTVKVKA